MMNLTLKEEISKYSINNDGKNDGFFDGYDNIRDADKNIFLTYLI